MKIHLISAAQVVKINVWVCEANNQDSHCYDVGKVESALHSTFYPGDPPFYHGNIPEVAATLCYYITKCHAFVDGNKRTAAIAATTFLDLNGLGLEVDDDDFADRVEEAAASTDSEGCISSLKAWFKANSVEL